MSHLWKSLGQKRTIAIRYEPTGQVLSYLSDMGDATRMALAHALVDAKLNAGKIPSPISLRKKIRPWFVSSMPYARHHINPVCSKAVALLRAYRKGHKRLGLPSLEKLSMRIDGELFKMTREDDGFVCIRITIRPKVYEYLRFRPNHKKWDAYSKGRLGEITLTDDRLLLTFVDGLATKPLGDPLVGVDLNFATVDCTPIDKGQQMMIGHPVTIPTGNIEHIQDLFSRRRRRLQLHVRNTHKRARKLEETRGRQRRRVRDALQKLTTHLVRRYPNATFVFEDLKHIRNKPTEGRRFRKRLNRWPYRMAQIMVDYKSPMATLYLTPRGTSSRCPVCGGKIEHPTRIPSDIRWRVSVCPTCGVNYDRNRLASLAIACRGARLCGRPFSVSEDASWLLVRDEYLWQGSVAGDTAMIAGGTEEGANAPKAAVS
jgi:putative transposase